MNALKKYSAEFLGTMMLCFVVTQTIAQDSFIPTPIAAALTLCILVYTMGGISGAHFNPALTIALTAFKRHGLVDGAVYLLAQFAAAAVVVVANIQFFGGSVNAPATDSGAGLAGELIGTAILTFAISSVVLGRAKQNASGIVIGGGLFIGIIFSGLIGSGSVLNPAVGLALNAVSPTYLAGSILGGLLGVGLSEILHPSDNA